MIVVPREALFVALALLSAWLLIIAAEHLDRTMAYNDHGCTEVPCNDINAVSTAFQENGQFVCRCVGGKP